MKLIHEDVRARVEHAAEEASPGHGRFSGYGRGNHSTTAVELPLGVLKSALAGNLAARDLVRDVCAMAEGAGCDMLSSWAGPRAMLIAHIAIADLRTLFGSRE
jgi:hypothetical protein